MRGLIVLLVVCTYTAAMVPAPRDAEASHVEKNTTKPYCAHTTPCAWVVHSTNAKIPTTIENDYCVCSEGTSCQFHEDDLSSSVNVHTCKSVKS